MRYVRTDSGARLVLRTPRETGLVPCTGEAHANAYIDNCGVCAPRWGRMMSYERLQPSACAGGAAVAVNDADREAFAKAEACGEVRMVHVTRRSGSFYAWVRT